MKKLSLVILLVVAFVVAANGATAQLNVMNFKARPGVVGFDNSTAFNAAINAAKKLGGGTVYAPSDNGIYYISNPIYATNAQVTLLGDSAVTAGVGTNNVGTIVYLNNGANCSMVVKELNTQITITGITFNGNRANQTVTAPGIWLKGDINVIDRTVLNNVILRYANGVGIQNDNRETRLENISVDFCAGDGIVNTATSDVYMYNLLVGFNDGNGVSMVGGVNGANSIVMNYANIFRNGIGGLLLTNANNNYFTFVKTDANVRDGILITGNSQRNEFHGCSPVVNNYPLTQTGAPSPIPTGTYSNMRLAGTNVGEVVIIGGNFYEYESALYIAYGYRPKYLFEDARTGIYGTTNLYKSVTLAGAKFTQADTFWTLGAYGLAMRTNAGGVWLEDGAPVHRNNDAWDVTTIGKARLYDQLEAAVGMQVNAYYNGGWLYRSNGPAYYLSARNDNPMSAYQYASSNSANTAITWNYAWNVNATNGYMALNKGLTPAVTRLEVVGGTVKSDSVESESLVSNAYYDGGWKYRAPGYAYQIQCQPSYGNFVVFTSAFGGAAGDPITFVPAIIADGTGAVTFPVSIASSLLSLAALNTAEVTTTNGVRFLPLASGPSAASIGAGNGQMWLSNDVSGTLYFRFTSDGIAVADTKLAP